MMFPSHPLASAGDLVSGHRLPGHDGIFRATSNLNMSIRDRPKNCDALESSAQRES